MEKGQQGLPQKEFPADDTVTQADYCTETGLLASTGCPHTKTGCYRQGHLPGLCVAHAANIAA